MNPTPVRPVSIADPDDAELDPAGGQDERLPFFGCLLAGFLILFPLCFGGVPPQLSLGAQILIFLTLAAVCFSSGFQTAMIKKQSLHYPLLILGLFMLFTLAYFLTHEFSSQPHPVLGSASLHPAADRFWGAFRGLLFFTAVLLLSSAALRMHTRMPRIFQTALLLSGFLVAMVALSHWFYDNGKLFWYFEPQSVFTSQRARAR